MRTPQSMEKSSLQGAEKQCRFAAKKETPLLWQRRPGFHSPISTASCHWNGCTKEWMSRGVLAKEMRQSQTTQLAAAQPTTAQQQA
jgi:hypothetical protein